MGTWGVGLFQCDDAADLRVDVREVVRAPWDGDRLLAWALDAYPELTDPQQEGHTDLRLALADVLWWYGIEQAEIRDAALAIVDNGADLESKRRLGMSDRDLARRAVVLDEHRAEDRDPHPARIAARAVSRPERRLDRDRPEQPGVRGHRVAERRVQQEGAHGEQRGDVDAGVVGRDAGSGAGPLESHGRTGAVAPAPGGRGRRALSRAPRPARRRAPPGRSAP
jgi:hypothetical protein